MRKHFLLFVLCITLFFSKKIDAQLVGDYISNTTIGTYSTPGTWLKCVTAGTWAGATVATSAPSSSVNVFIRSGDSITVTATANCKNLTVDNGATFSIGSASTPITLNCAGNCYVSTTGKINTAIAATQHVLRFTSTTSADLTIDGNFGTSDGRLLNVYPSNGTPMTLNIKSNLANPPTAYINLVKFQANGSTVVFQRDVTLTNGAVALAFNNASTTGYDNCTVTIDAGKTVTLATGAVAINTSGTTAPSAAGNNLVLNVNGILDILANNLNIRSVAGKTFALNVGSSGVLNIYRKFNLFSGEGTTNINVSAGGQVNFPAVGLGQCVLPASSVTVNMLGTWNFANTPAVIRNVANTADSLYRGLGTASVTGKIIYPDAGTYPNSGITLNTGSTVEYRGTTAYTLNNNFSTYHNLLINNPRGVTLGTATTVNGVLTVSELDSLSTGANNLTLGASASANFEAGSVLNINNALAGVNFSLRPITFKSSATGSAKIASVLGSYSGSDNVTVERYVEGGRRAYRFVGHPFSTATALSQFADEVDITGSTGTTGGFTDNSHLSPSAFYYDVTTGNASLSNDPGWKPFTSTSTTISSGNGFRLYVRGSKGQAGIFTAPYSTPNANTISVTGTLNNNGDYIKPLVQGGLSGYNFVSNPYVSPVNLSGVAHTAGVNSNFYIWNARLGNSGGYVTYTFGVDNYSLPSCASFFVTTTGPSETITFTESDKTATDTSTMLRQIATKGRVELTINSNNNLWDRFVLSFDKKANPSFDKILDATKFKNLDANFYSISTEGKSLAVDVRPYDVDATIPMGFTSNAARAYTLNVNTMNVEAGNELYLRDKYLHTETKLAQGVQYEFSTDANPASQGEQRFELVGKIVKPIIAVENASIKLAPNPTTDNFQITFNNIEKVATSIVVTNAEGRVVKTINAGTIATGQINISTKGLAKGIYNVTLQAKGNTTTQKLVVQ